jgi:hypothetical protein
MKVLLKPASQPSAAPDPGRAAPSGRKIVASPRTSGADLPVGCSADVPVRARRSLLRHQSWGFPCPSLLGTGETTNSKRPVSHRPTQSTAPTEPQIVTFPWSILPHRSARKFTDRNFIENALIEKGFGTTGAFPGLPRPKLASFFSSKVGRPPSPGTASLVPARCGSD